VISYFQERSTPRFTPATANRASARSRSAGAIGLGIAGLLLLAGCGGDDATEATTSLALSNQQAIAAPGAQGTDDSDASPARTALDELPSWMPEGFDGDEDNESASATTTIAADDRGTAGAGTVTPVQLPVTASTSAVPSTEAESTTTETTPPTTMVETTAEPSTTTTIAVETTEATPAPEPSTTATQPEPTPTTSPPAAAEPGMPTEEQWAALRMCEASGNYQISSSNGLYHGAYQFHQPTWDDLAKRHNRADLVGVKPSNASPADQDAMARALYRERGSQPWPHCGRHLN